MNKNKEGIILNYWNYTTETFMVKVPYGNIKLFKDLFRFKIQSDVLHDEHNMKYIKGNKSTPEFIQKEFNRETFTTFLKTHKKELKEFGIILNKIKE
jgi:hypothetical protein